MRAPPLCGRYERRCMPMTTIYLCRHGVTDWNRDGRWQGQTDVPLNETGRLQAAALAESLRGVPLVAVYTSTLQRAIQTGQIVARLHGIPLFHDARLREMHLGLWEGTQRADRARLDQQVMAAWRDTPRRIRPPGGESIDELDERVSAALYDIITAYPDASVCMVGHRMTNAVIRSQVLGRPLEETLADEAAHAVWERLDA